MTPAEQAELVDLVRAGAVLYIGWLAMFLGGVFWERYRQAERREKQQ